MTRPREGGDVQARHTKIVATIGPATDGLLAELIEAGLDVARVNFSHGTPDDHDRRFRAIATAREAAGRAVATLADLPGPKIRLGTFSVGEARLRSGDRFVLRTGGPEGDASSATTTHGALAHDVRPGDRVLLADGAAELRVVAIEDQDVVTEIVRGGTVRSRQGVNVPSERLSLPAITAADRDALPRAIAGGADFVAQSFVRSADDIRELRALMGEARLPVVAKIETQSAVDRLDSILDEADVLMVARGDLGVEIPFEEVPLVQKSIVRRALERGVPTIVATQMLESMVHAPRPTRAEASDVANAVFDGADAVMLSAETAVGAHPLAAAAAAAAICVAAERRGAAWFAVGSLRRSTDTSTRDAVLGSDDGAVAYAAVALARRAPQVAAIACFTRSGRTAESLSSLRPGVPIFAFTPDPSVARLLAVRSAVMPFEFPEPSREETIAEAMARRLAAGRLVPEGASVLLVRTSRSPGGSNELRILPVEGG
jgi:pyruvate kinase